MNTRKLSANYIFTGKSVLKNGIIEIAPNGEITKVIDTKGDLQESASLEFFPGVLTPGFVNAHCHLELSHMKGVIDNKTVKGLPGFVHEIIRKRNFPEDLEEQIRKADREMQTEGIVAVGDISNTDDSFSVKTKSPIYYQTFVETFAVSNQAAEENFETAKQNLSILQSLHLPGNIVPHAVYSVPDTLAEEIAQFHAKNSGIISIHNQETESEDLMLQTKKGILAETLGDLGFQLSDFNFDTESATVHNLKNQEAIKHILLIHNTFSKKDDIRTMEKYSQKVFPVFCPLSNLYIEKRLPDLPSFFTSEKLSCCFGTDSYASNHCLSILEELKAVVTSYPTIPFEKLVQAATLNGARALQIEEQFGSIEVGKTPGINLITDFDGKKMTLSPRSKVKVLVPGKRTRN